MLAGTTSESLAVPASPVGRLFAVIELLARMGVISVADVVCLLDIPRPSAHRMIATLRALGVLQKLPTKGKYAVAPKFVRLTTSILTSTLVYAPMQALLNSIAQKTGETCAIAVPAASEVEYIASVTPSTRTLQFQSGQKAPLYCTSSGHLFLSYLPPTELDQYLASGPWEKLTDYTINDPEQLRIQLRRVRSQGYAANESAYIAGVVGVAVPIQSTRESGIASLSLSAPTSRRTLQDVIAMVPTLRNYAERIRRVLHPR